MASKSRISSADIARMTGVSRATVSYIINNRVDQTISDETRKRVLDAIEESGYRPNSVARALVSGRTMTVALWVPIVNRSVSGHFINHIGRLAKADGYHVIVVEIAGETPDSLSSTGLLDAGQVDGIIAVDATALIEGLLDRFQNLPPIVSMGPAYSTHTDYAGVDLAGGSRLVMQHLIERGCTKIALISDQISSSPGDPRYDAYMEGVRMLGTKPDVLPVESVRMADSYWAVRERFERSNPPDGLMCFNDECAIGANKALSDMGIDVPGEVIIIGSDGIAETQYSVPEISTVAQPFEATCSRAWHFFLRRLEQPGAPICGEVLQMNLIVRRSTTPSTLPQSSAESVTHLT
jgi:LacI family transcriptional regulator